MKRFTFGILGLQIVSALFSAFGVVLAFFNKNVLFQEWINRFINAAFFVDVIPTETTLQMQSWLYGVLGATCVLLGILTFCIVTFALAKREKWAWYALFIGVVAWFAIDQIVSFQYRVTFNLLFNTILLFAILIPLWMARPVIQFVEETVDFE
jgi:hypothetical protein